MKEQFTVSPDARAMPARNDKETGPVDDADDVEQTSQPEEQEQAAAKAAPPWRRRTPTRRLSDEEVKALTDQYFADGKRITKCPPGQAGKA
jgi:hypothetical protein